MGQILSEVGRVAVSRWIIASDVVAMGKLMMTAVRSDTATKMRHFRIIVVMGGITHAADAAGCLASCRADGSLRPARSPR